MAVLSTYNESTGVKQNHQARTNGNHAIIFYMTGKYDGVFLFFFCNNLSSN
jgi:hypothetical protein